MSTPLPYAGTQTLEFLQDAVNYNKYLEGELVKFIRPCIESLDFGAGIGEFAKRVSEHGVTVKCVELDNELQEHLRKNGFATFASIDDSPQISRVYSLNVLEHIEDDVSALRDIYKKLTDSGKLLIYVPAFMSLYTEFDKSIGHYRRYTLKELTSKLQMAGFSIERAEYVDSIGFFCWFIMGKLPSNKKNINPLMIKLFDRVLFPISRVADIFFNKMFGKNLLIIAKKSS